MSIFRFFFSLTFLSFPNTIEERKKERKKERKVNSMLSFENQEVEFKQEYVPEIRKEVIAFANASGGTILIGVRKDGAIIGVDDPDAIMLQVAGSLKDSIAPDIMPFVNIKTVEIDKKTVVEINISTGTNRPYYIREKGLKPSGVYVRKGSSSQPMTDEGIREMIIQSGRCSYETSRSMNQNLTFEYFENEMHKRKIAFGRSQMQTLKLIGDDHLYTNLALLLSDQCEVTTKAALFQGTDKAVFRDRKEFSGSILKQLEDVYQFIDLNNKTQASFSGLIRIDKKDYPEEAIREALLNSIVHRDYSFSGSNLINIYDDRIEIVSLGGLVSGLELNSIFLGLSQPRNPNLAAIFYRMMLIESYGTGIGKIQRAYGDNEKKPFFETAKGVFRVTLPNRNEGMQKLSKPRKRLVAVYRQPLASEKEEILSYVAEHKKITRKETEALLNIGTTKAYRILKELSSAGKLHINGSGKNVYYTGE